MRIRCPELCLILMLAAAAPAGAQPPTPLDLPWLYAFPGAVQGPASAISAGLGLADRWLGDEPFDNPAAAPARGLMVAPVFLRMKRQDLPADFRNYEENGGFLDVAGGRVALPVRGVGVALYAYEPVLRQEEQVFTARPDERPRAFTSSVSARELRAGLALSRAWGAARLGAALEWTRRDDAYDYTERSGDPLQGERHVDLAGDGFGFQAGARVPVSPRVTLGGALRYLPALDLSGRQTVPTLALDRDVTATREAGWEGGLSARVAVTEAFRVLVAAGGRTAQAWDGVGVTSGRSASWGLGIEYEEPDQPLALRLGLGREQQDAVPEPAAGIFGLGLGWKLDDVRLDVGVLRRSVARPGKPTSYDDRVVAGATVGF